MAGQSPTEYHRRSSTVTGYFLQDDDDTDARTFDYTLNNFGLKPLSASSDSSKTQWQLFEDQVSLLNNESPQNVSYKVLFLGRHGQGVHNVAEAFYGTKVWDCEWSMRDGNETSYWVDAHLTLTGIAQARAARTFWAQQIANEKIPLPQSYYTSPLDRCLATAQLTFGDLPLPPDRLFIPIVKELLRETNGLHTCDRRSSRTYIHTTYPSYHIEPGFTENDELWVADLRESNSALDSRLKVLLDDIFEHDNVTFISLTAHSGAIAGLLRVLGHQEFRLVTGSVLPVLIRTEVVSGVEKPGKVEPWVPFVSCAADK